MKNNVDTQKIIKVVNEYQLNQKLFHWDNESMYGGSNQMKLKIARQYKEIQTCIDRIIKTYGSEQELYRRVREIREKRKLQK